MKVNPKVTIKRNKLLPGSLVIRRAGTHLYSIGLSLYKPLNATNRSLIYNPYFVFTFFLMFYIREIILFIIPEKSENFYLLVGEISHFIGHRIATELLVSNTIQIIIFSQLLNYYNYSRGIKPRDLCVFWMLSGLITPISIGIHDKHFIQKLLTFSRKLLLY